MFEFSFLPFSTSNTLYFNSELYSINLNISKVHEYSTKITKLIELSLNIEQNNTLIL
jgi:hypothetical protein